jgi:ribonuclease BN (tRNA processing enzyme)
MQHRQDTAALTLTILGTATPYPRPDQPCSGYLVASATTRLWVDAGGGTFAALQRFAGPSDLDALWFSHMHPDHTGDLPSVASWLINRPGEQPPLAVYGPAGWVEHLNAFLPTSPQLLRRHIDAYELFDGHAITIGDLQLTSRAVRHSVEAYGVRIEVGPRALAYSGDTARCAELDELANHADVLLCETGAAMQPTDREPTHCTPEDAANTAKQAGAKRLLLTHLAPTLTPAAALTRAANIHRETALATPGAIHEL